MRARVIDWGEIYSQYDKWFKQNNCEQYLEQYNQDNRLVANIGFPCGSAVPYDKEGRIIDTYNIVYKVLTLGPHERSEWGMLYAIEEPITKKIFLINGKGLEFLD